MAPGSNWERAQEMAKKHEQSGGLWLKLANDGDKAVIVFVGDPYPREVCFVDGKYLPFDETLKAQGQKPSLRVALNVVVYESNEVKVLEQGSNFFKDLVRIREKYGLEKWAFEVQRHGAAKDPKTTYSILPERQLTVEQQHAYQNIKLHDLEAVYTDASSNEEALGSYDRKNDGVIDAGTAQALTAQLKLLPREAVDRFCKKFGVQRIKDLPAPLLDKARALIEVLASEFAAPSAPSAEQDPFA